MMVEGGEVPDFPGQEGYSGSIRYFAGSVDWLQHHGYEVVFGTLREEGPLHPVMESLSCSTFALGAGSGLTYPSAARRLAKVIRDHAPDVLHFNESIQAAIGGVTSTLTRRGISIFHRHHTTIPGPTRLLSRIAGRTCHVTMAVSHAVAENAYRERVGRDRVFVAHNGVPDPQPVAREEIEAARQLLGIRPDEKVVVVVGRLRPEKGHLTLVKAFRLISSRIETPVHLVVVGSGTQEGLIRAEASNLERVHLLGHQPDVAVWFKLGDVAVVPSLKEPFGLVAAEAMACTRPLVASDVDGLREIVEHERSGVLVPPGQVDPLADAIAGILMSRSRADALAAAARKRFESTFTLAAMAERWMEIYERVWFARNR